jgi:hypothetical protein
MENFNTAGLAEPKTVVKTVLIGWEHDVVEDEDGRRLEYRVDENGARIPRKYLVPVSLTADQMLERSKLVNVEAFQRLGAGDIEALMEILDALIGDDIIGRIGSDESVPVADYFRFMNWLLEQLNLTELFGGPGN